MILSSTSTVLTSPTAGTGTVKESAASILSRGIFVLTKGLTAGEEVAFREFHELYFDRLYHFLLVVTRGQEEEAREALQQTLLRVLRYARPFETEEALWGWLRVLARSAARDSGRKQHRYLALLQKFAMWRRTLDEPHVDASEVRALLWEALEELEPGDRWLIETKYLKGGTVREMATQMGLTEKAVESRLLRVRRLLRQRTLEKLH